MHKKGIIIKDRQQIEGIRRSCRLASDTLDYLKSYVTEGITTEELNQIAEKFIYDKGGIPAPLNYQGYPKSTCISVNEVICHGIPDSYKLKNGDILNIDVSTILDGFYGDTGRMYSVGKISEDAKHIIRVARECLEIGIRQVRPGNYFGNIGFEIQKYATLRGCTVVFQYCGHGIGIRFHEEPEIAHIAPKNSGLIMKEGMIFTIEPMINLGAPDAIINEQDGWTARTADGKLSAQYEHSVLVTKTGVEVLT
jgi:methionyl aminopeptidase